MLLYLGQRIVLFVATLFFASLVVFALMQILPGDAAETMLGPTATPEAVAALSHKLGPHLPARLRYAPLVGRRPCGGRRRRPRRSRRSRTSSGSICRRPSATRTGSGAPCTAISAYPMLTARRSVP